MFRSVNLPEYKSPGNYVSIADFYKVYGYACLYASFERVPITDMTITFVESRHPQKLLDHLKTIRGYLVERLMREKKLVARRPIKWAKTTDTKHKLPISDISWSGILRLPSPVKNGFSTLPI